MRELIHELDERLIGGTDFLRSARSADGLWWDFRTLAGQSSDWVTAFVAYAMKQVGFSDGTADSALSVLLPRQRRNGGWGYNDNVPADCDSTAWALLGLMACPKCEPSVIRRGVEFLWFHQSESLEGGFSTYVPSDGIDFFIGAGGSESVAGWMDAHVCVTSLALQALLTAWQSAQSEGITKALQYLLRKRTAEGIWRSYWWKGRAYSTYHALRALSLAGASSSPDSLAVARYFVARQWNGGAWGADKEEAGSVPDAFETAFVLLALSLCKGAAILGAAEQGLRWLLSQQDEDGSWPSVPILRIPPPALKDPDRRRMWRPNSMGTGVIIQDEGRLFTTAAVVWALAESRSIICDKVR